MEDERAALYATPERVAQIECTQPESESWGRSLFFRPGTVTGTVKQRSRPEEEEPGVVVPAWRKTFEFSGDEGALASDRDADILPDMDDGVVEPGEAEESLVAVAN